jgi:NitT/TauT family transport system ATP-binding protein
MSFSVRRGSFVCFVGSDPIRQTVFLRMLAGLTVPSSGRLLVLGRPVAAMRSHPTIVTRESSRSLLPWLNVNENVALALETSGLPRTDRIECAHDVLVAVGLDGHDALFPDQLSASAQIRVQLARSLAARPRLLLLDEPFSLLDAESRKNIQDHLLAVCAATAITVVMTTTDVDEAAYLGDRIVVLGGSPATILADVLSDVPRPRSYHSTRGHRSFRSMRRGVSSIVHAEQRLLQPPS